MLQMMGVATYRQIARWTERDIDEFDAKLPSSPDASAATRGSRRRERCTRASTARRCLCGDADDVGAVARA
jgi:hypothetical protein